MRQLRGTTDSVPASISRRLVGITYVIVLLTAVLDLISDEYADLARVLIKALGGQRMTMSFNS